MSDDRSYFGGMEISPQKNENGKPEYQVVLPCDVKNFRSFVSGLLGKPQELRYELPGVYKVHPQQVANIYHLINQRVEKQNAGSLIHFEIAVNYDDGNSVTHHNIPDFESFHPTTKCYPIEITLTFIYLIQFVGKEAPEKQEIQVSISTDVERSRFQAVNWYSGGLFAVRIQHTERTWASDIGGLLKNHAENMVDKATRVKQFLSRRGDELIASFLLVVFIATLCAWTYQTLGRLDKHPFNEITTQKYFVLSLTIFVVLGSILNVIKRYFESFVYLGAQSYIALTDNDNTRMKKEETKLGRKYLLYVTGWLLGLASGILSNYIYSHL
ncbi:hypothetical protein [Collimonas sp. OK412]|jgi:hypothetical protein|uniref:hypothetical protein n=1 Tax=Collimonas sp. (strain OK412) TaxID=1801619 RepID=UPI0008E71702|nr:hypothetical protein [Collimonas sp. OK412]SFC77590.1 hypothetical protein SAMN04515619_11353 [Collimonas sp. OK412]